ncbi:MAG: flagellar type III secretion system pore protein FliP [Desulfatibacillum sp.]|nr:flagellar type III secretion system pore protein FliP [Desulfatibacillum sp.]
MKTARKTWVKIFALVAFITLVPVLGHAVTIAVPSLQIGVEEATGPEQVSVLLQIVAMLTILTLAPAILMLMTSFTRLAIVFSFLRHALGTQQMPPNQIMVGLALFLTVFIMMPVWQDINTNALQPYLNEEIAEDVAIENAVKPLRAFMFRYTREKDLGLFIKISGASKPQGPEDVSIWSLIPAFVISELTTAFMIGFVIYVPFMIIDMVVASVLLSMGMMMLPPVMISLPFKLMLFVLVDGWSLIVGSLVQSFVGG